MCVGVQIINNVYIGSGCAYDALLVAILIVKRRAETNWTMDTSIFLARLICDNIKAPFLVAPCSSLLVGVENTQMAML